MNNLTIQINNLEALERLIGGDSQVEVEVRNSVVQRFAEKHLKPLANSPTLTLYMDRLKQDIQRQVADKIEQEIATFKKTYGGSFTDVKLKPEIEQEIDNRVRALTDNIIREKIDKSVKFWSNDVELTKRINSRFEYYTKETINNEVKARLEKVKSSLDNT